MKTIVIYHSQTGFTKRYAEWIAQAAEADCLELSAAKKQDLSAYEAIIYGGFACAGGISRLGWFKSHISQWADKKLIVFCVGASPSSSPDIAPALRQNFTAEEFAKVDVFYCPGGLNYENMSGPSRLLMKLFRKAVNAKKDKTKEDQAMVKMLASSYDITDKTYIEPILNCLGQ